MVHTNSLPFAEGLKPPNFELLEPATGKTRKLEEFAGGKGLLIIVMCNHCPFVIHYKESIASYVKEIQAKGINVVAILSNDIESHPQDSPENMAKDVQNLGYTFPYLFDETQEVAKALKALSTPEFYLYDQNSLLYYHGRFDASRPQKYSKTPQKVTGEDIRQAVTQLLNSQPPPQTQYNSIGCNIKWKPGNEPSYQQAA